jgi:predicted DNA-binding transcriptional regulator AlpA
MFDPASGTRYVDVRQIVCYKGRPGILPLGKSALYELIAKGVIPRPIKIGRRSVWRESDIRAAIEKLAAEG